MLLDGTELSRLRWRCRRGMLENDLFIERFFRQYEETITTRQATGLMALMDLPDGDLLDLLLRRSEPRDGLDRADVKEVLELMRRSPVATQGAAAAQRPGVGAAAPGGLPGAHPDRETFQKGNAT